jgi:hypothetical protein
MIPLHYLDKGDKGVERSLSWVMSMFAYWREEDGLVGTMMT